ncbi:MAG TPA: glycoside hydrolase family 43 protein [Sedimentisphaerales bacterium]|nr:glycoside hydrolase family 43 protein [Sedimentisphaerales bacterium]HRS11311.1 glycoside hydrolase family 43 protein [Sedimentisphaerales bacterium]HRV47883.1 glycoside hydrolase family 43 protein [Sedimentisphaerales bacterium]
MRSSRMPAIVWLVSIVLSSPLSTARAVQRLITNPVAPEGHDPWVTQFEGVYHYCYSHKGAIWVHSAPRIEEAVQFEGRQVWRPERGMPYSRELWAPELHRLWGGWYIYVAADDGNNENHRMYVLQADTEDPAGSYTIRGKIADPSDKWAIDGTVMLYDGRLYLIWSGWEGDTNIAQNLYIAPMKDPLSIDGPRSLISKPEYDWEQIGKPLVNEGPEVLTHADDVFIIYSASGSWTDDYCLGQLKLVGDDPLDPASWQKKNTPVFGSTATVFGPGHASFARSPDGSEDWIIYHAAKRQGSGWDRNTRMQRFTWDVEGNPCFGYPVSEGVPIAAPSE